MKDAEEQAGESSRAGPRSARRILAVFAHPDDEIFCAGGTLARYVDEGAEAMVVSATRGEAGQIRDARAATRRTLAEVRDQELRAGCACLGIQHVRCLGFRDGMLGSVDRAVMVADVTDLIEEFAPHVVVTFGTDGAYGHPDHVAISEATTAAFRLAAEASLAVVETGPPPRLYHSHFPRSRLLILDQLAHWLVEQPHGFRGQVEFLQGLALFAQESTTMRYAGDHVDVSWFPPGIYVLEQGEPATSLYLILSGEVDVVREESDGRMDVLARLGPGEFFGELGLVNRQGRSAHVIAVSSLTCLVLSPAPPTAYGGRGPVDDATARDDDGAEPWAVRGATTEIDVSSYVTKKVAALAQHRTQYPISADMFPTEMLRQMLGRELFLRVYPPMEREADLFPPG